MPRELKELGNFNFGTIFTSSEEDIPENGNAFSLNVDPLSKAGVLNGINSDRFVTSLVNPLIQLVNPVVWNKTDDIDVEDISTIVGNDIRFIGSKGILERLHFAALQPYLSVYDVLGTNLSIRFDTEIDSAETLTTIPNNQGLGTGTTASFHNYIESGDIIQISTDTTINAKKEILIISSKASDGNSFEVIRGAYGSPRTSFAQDTTYNVLVNVVKFGSTYERTKRAVLRSISGWSAYEGNHLGGNASIAYSGLSANSSLKIDANDYNITFDATEKTMAFLSKDEGDEAYSLPELPDNLQVGDVFSIWTAVADANNSTQFKVMAIDAEAAASGATITFHLDSAPTAGTHTTGDFYFEPGLIQNQTFHWLHDASYPYNWEEQKRNSAGVITINGEGFVVSDNAAGTDVAQATSGGYYDSTDLSLYGLADSSASYYPFAAGDAYMKLMNDETLLGGSISTGTAIDAIQTTITATNTVTSNYPIRPGDVIKVDSEFMKVVSAEINILTVIRGFYGSTAAAHGAQATTSVACHVNNADDQTITIISTDGTSVEYTGKDAGDDDAAGEFDTNGSAADAADGLQACIEHANGHAGRITVENNGSGTLTLTQTVNGLAGNTTWTSTLTGTSSGAFSGGTDEIAMYIVNFNGIRQTVPESLLEKGAQYRLSFKAKDTNAAADGESGGEGSIRIKYGGLYANNQGGADIITPVDSMTALIPFIDLIHTESNRDIRTDGLDFTWRTLHYDFTIDRAADLSDGLRIEIMSSGPVDTYIGIDIVTLNRKPDLLSTNDTFGETGNLGSIGYINHGDAKDIVTFDGEKQTLSMLQDFGVSNTLLKSFSQSESVSDSISSNSKKATFESNNQEVHIGFGSHEDDTPPLWLGYLNRKVFGVSYSNALYLDTDSPTNVSDASSSYGLGGNAFHKLAPAGEFEMVGVASWSSDELVIDHVAHSLNTGDNIVIREYMDIDNSWDGNGVWVVTDTTNDTFDCKRFTPANGGIDNNPTGLPANSLISYRPYYYYAIQRGSGTLFRIFPDIRINDTATGLDENYPMGHVQPNIKLDSDNITSICPSYNKKSDGLGGGQLYILESVVGNPKISKMSVMAKYDEWGDANLGSDVSYQINYKNFKWSNEVGDLPTTDTDKRFGYVKKESVGAAINLRGASIPSDILETKGPNEDFDYTVTANNNSALAPAAFDTRLWLQFSPGEAEYFVEGDRFLFCGKPESDDSGGVVLDMADRTPPTQVFFGAYMPIVESYHATLGAGGEDNSSGYRQLSGPGLSCDSTDSAFWFPNTSHIGWGTWLGKYGETKDYEDEGFTKEHVAQRGFYASDLLEHPRRTATQSNGPWLRNWKAGYSLKRFKVRTSSGTDSSSYDGSYEWTSALQDSLGDASQPVYFNMTNLGDNMGWNERCRIYVAFYGLFQMADNDGDGVIDGTGLVTKSVQSNITGKPYGELEKKVSSHCVGILGGSGTNWWASIGKKTQMLGGTFEDVGRLAGISGCNSMDFIEGERSTDRSYTNLRFDKPRFYNFFGFYNTIALRLNMKECIFICSDVNFGDYVQPNKYIDISSIEAYDWGQGTDYATKINTAGTHYLQAGDLVYLESTGGSDSNIFGTVGSTDGDGISYYVAAVLSDTAFVITHGTHEGIGTRSNTTENSGRVYFGGFRRISWLSSTTSSKVGLMEESSRGGEGKTGFHFDYDEEDYGNGGIFEQGQYGPSWYSESFNIGHPGIAAYHDYNMNTNPPWIAYPGTEISGETVDTGIIDKRRDDAVFPETLFRFDRLNASCGFMIRPIDTDGGIFASHVPDFGFMADKISVSVPCFPNPIQHKGNYNSGETENQYSSYMLISSATISDESSTVRDSSRITIKQYSIPSFTTNAFSEDTLYPMSKMYGGSNIWEQGTLTDDHSDGINHYYADEGEQKVVSSGGTIYSEVRENSLVGNPGKNFNGTKASYIAAGTTADSGYIYADSVAHPDAAIHPKLIVHGDEGSLWNYTESSTPRSQTSAKTFKDIDLSTTIGNRSFYRTRNVFAGCYIVIMNQIRKIIGSYSLGVNNTDDMVFVIHHPLIGTVDDNTTYRIYSGASMCHSGVSSKVISPRSETYFGLTNSSQTMESSGQSAEIILTENSSYDSELDTTGGWRAGDTVNLTSTSELLPEDGDAVLLNGEFVITREVNFDAFAIQGESDVVYKDTQSINVSIQNKDSAMKNPITSEVIGSGPIHATFGGLDMRNISDGVTSGTTSDISTSFSLGDIVGTIIATTDIAHGLKSGDLVTLVSQGSNKEMEGSYIITVPQGTTTIFEFNSTNTVNLSQDYFVFKDAVELFQTVRNGNIAVSKVRVGDRVWDTGNTHGNALRQDKDVDVNQVILSEEFAQRVVGVGKDSDESFFVLGKQYKYKLSFIYDGYQESPLSGIFATHFDTAHSYERLEITLEVDTEILSKRISDIALYRKDVGSMYKLVKVIPTKDGWINIPEKTQVYRLIDDDGSLGASYEARSGLSELMSDASVKYGISKAMDGYLFVGDCSHEKIDDASNLVFRSLPGKYSLFNWFVDFIQLPTTPVAMANFLGRLYIFDKNNIYKINPHSMAIEDTFEGIGCISKDSVIVTEYGMFFADRNGAYMHNGQVPVKISTPIQSGGKTDMLSISNASSTGVTTIDDISWENTVLAEDSMPPYVSFLANKECVLFIVELKSVDSNGHYFSKYLAWSYQITFKRWDLWTLCENEKPGIPFIGKKGEVFISIGNALYEYLGAKGRKPFTWLSKKLSMEQDTVTKVFKNIKINGSLDRLNYSGTLGNFSNDRIIVTTDAGRLDGSSLTYSTESNETSKYTLTGANRKGKWMQIKLEDIDNPIDSIGILFRRRRVK
jgi:hypothetical protein